MTDGGEPLFYAITLTAGEDGKVEFGTQTHWSGWADFKKKQELRKARLVFRRFVELWEGVRQPYRVVEHLEELGPFIREGGHALVAQDIADAVLGHILHKDLESVPRWPAGFVGKSLIPEAQFNRAPSARLRMQILKRDGRKCRICGRSPDSNTDLELHVHHIWPWGEGGLTEPDNLITLCHTCHGGLDPHFDQNLYEYVRPSVPDPVEQARVAHLEAVARYRKVGGMFGSD